MIEIGVADAPIDMLIASTDCQIRMLLEELNQGCAGRVLRSWGRERLQVRDKDRGPVRWSETWLKLAEKYCSG